jgi:hypothetical protein
MSWQKAQSWPPLVRENDNDEIALENQKKLESLFPKTNEFTEANRKKAINTLLWSKSKVSKIVWLTLEQEEEIKVGSFGNLNDLRNKWYTDKQILLVLALQEWTDVARYTQHAYHLIRSNAISQLSETDFLELIYTPGGMVILDDVLFEKKHIDHEIRFFMPLSIRALQKLIETGNDRFVLSHLDSFQIDDTVKAILQKCEYEKKFRASMNKSFAQFQKQLEPINPQLIAQFHETVQENMFKKTLYKMQEIRYNLKNINNKFLVESFGLMYVAAALIPMAITYIIKSVWDIFGYNLDNVDMFHSIYPYSLVIFGLLWILWTIGMISEESSKVVESHWDALLQRRSFKQGEVWLNLEELSRLKKELSKGTPVYKEVSMMIDLFEKKGLDSEKMQDQKHLFADILQWWRTNNHQMQNDTIMTTVKKLLCSVEQSTSSDDQRKIFQWIETLVKKEKGDISELLPEKVWISSRNLPALQWIDTVKDLDDLLLPRIEEFLSRYDFKDVSNTGSVTVIKDTFLINQFADSHSIISFAKKYKEVFKKILSNISSIDEFVTLFQTKHHKWELIAHWIELYKASIRFLDYWNDADDSNLYNEHINSINWIVWRKITELCIQDNNANTSTKKKLIQMHKDVNLIPDRE